jgi:hypothetical protein
VLNDNNGELIIVKEVSVSHMDDLEHVEKSKRQFLIWSCGWGIEDLISLHSYTHPTPLSLSLSLSIVQKPLSLIVARQHSLIILQHLSRIVEPSLRTGPSKLINNFVKKNHFEIHPTTDVILNATRSVHHPHYLYCHRVLQSMNPNVAQCWHKLGQL